MTGTELDEILADTAAPETQDADRQETETTQTQPRDETGRFATKAEQTAEPQEQEVEEEHETVENGGKVPQQALHASRQKEREARQEAETLKQQLAELRGQVQLLSQRPQQQEKPKVEEQKPADFWEDPDSYFASRLTPVQQQLQQQAERFSMRMAIKEYGKEAVDAAYGALGRAMQSGDPNAHAEFQRIKASEDPYEDIVRWHKRNETLKTVGSDPNAWLEAEMEKRLSDPAYQAKVLERIKATATTTGRSNPVTQLPPSLNRLPAGGNAAEDTDTSDAALFSFASR